MFRSMGLLFRRIPEGATLYSVAGVAVVEMAAVDSSLKRPDFMHHL